MSKLEAFPQTPEHLGEHIRSNFDFAYGVSARLPRDPIQLSNLVEVPSSFEQYTSADGLYAGAIATKHAAPPDSLITETYSGIHGPSSGLYINLSEAEKHFGSGTLLEPLARSMGMSFEKVKSERGRKEVSAVFPLDIAEINDRFAALGITDRQAADWHGDFSTDVLMSAFDRGELLFANEGWQLTHDRVAHLIGYTLLAPSIWERLQQEGREIDAELRPLQARLTEAWEINNDWSDLRQYWAVRKPGEVLTARFDFSPTRLSQLLAQERPDRQQVGAELAQLLDAQAINQDGEYAPEEMMAREIDETIAWRDTLLQVAA